MANTTCIGQHSKQAVLLWRLWARRRLWGETNKTIAPGRDHTGTTQEPHRNHVENQVQIDLISRSSLISSRQSESSGLQGPGGKVEDNEMYVRGNILWASRATLRHGCCTSPCVTRRCGLGLEEDNNPNTGPNS